MLQAGQKTLSHRKTASTVYCVLEGEGYTEVEGQRLEWKRNDVFTVPGWLWHSHQNTSAQDAFLYSVTDEPAVRKLGLFREEGRMADGKTVPVN
jgi:gentisate 1,2-dioxygenase